MPNTTVLEQDLQDSQYLKTITQALGEIAALKLKATKQKIEHNSKYFQEIRGVFHQVKIMATKKQIPTQPKNGKTICILITSSFKFNGDLDNQLSRFFVAQTEKLTTDRIVIGTTGRSILTAMQYRQAYDFVRMEKDFPNLTELTDLVNKVKDYSRILVFYSRFESLLSQPPTYTDLLESTAEAEATTTKINFIFEPEIGKMMTFFEGQMLNLLMQAIFLEQELARTGARMISMNQAENNADDSITLQKHELVKAKQSILNAQILETFAGRERKNL